MSEYYSKDQVNEIAVFMANAISEYGEGLKTALQEKIDNLVPITPEPDEPATPSEPTGGAAGVFLDDGREIKTKVIEFKLNYNQYQYQPISALNIISATCLIDGFTPNHNSENYDYTFTATPSQIGIQLKTATSELRGKNAVVMLTYLA